MGRYLIMSQSVPQLILTNAVRNHLKNNSTESKSNAQVQQVINYIKEHYSNDISLDDISASIGLNSKYVCTLLKRQTGTSYLGGLHQERIDIAKKLLCDDSSCTIDDIAHKVGYNSSTQLARVFRKYEHMSPSDYRETLTL
ncbi:AraC family transcriptional regulator [Lachnospiraceae bacterium ZAX-1]